MLLKNWNQFKCVYSLNAYLYTIPCAYTKCRYIIKRGKEKNKQTWPKKSLNILENSFPSRRSVLKEKESSFWFKLRWSFIFFDIHLSLAETVKNSKV